MGGVDENNSRNRSAEMDTVNDARYKCLEFLWRFFSNGANPDEFDGYCFLGGFCFGTGSSVVLGRVLRNAFLISTGGIITTLLLSHYGFVSVDINGVKTVIQESADDARSKVETVVTEASNCFFCMGNSFFGEDIPKNRVISALLGTATGFGIGLILF